MGPLPDLVRESGGARALAKLFRQQGLPLAVIDTPSSRIPVIDMVELFAGGARATGDDAFGLTVGSRMRPQDFGPWVGAAAAAPTLGSALARLVRGVAAFQPDTLHLRVVGDAAQLVYRPRIRLPSLGRHHADHVLAPMVAFVRRFLGPAWAPVSVLLPYAAGPDARTVERFLEAPPLCAQDGVGVAIPRELLGARSGSSGNRHAPIEWAPSDKLEETVSAVTADIVAVRLLDGEADLEGTARRLRLHPRALQRALAGEGTSYREVVDRMRAARARLLLGRCDREIGEIALALGYEEPAHFTRAFRRWTGTTPSHWRQAVASTDPNGRSSSAIFDGSERRRPPPLPADVPTARSG